MSDQEAAESLRLRQAELLRRKDIGTERWLAGKL
jgi:hypothetical protein